MKSIMRILILLAVTVVLAGALIWAFVTGRSQQAAREQREAPLQSPSRITTDDGNAVLSFDVPAQQKNGIVTTVPVRDKRSMELQATGVVLQLQPLLDLKASYNAAVTDLVKARANARASLAEYERLRQLNQDGKNASDRAVEAAHATSESDAALVDSAEQSLGVLKSSIPLRWGPVIANWLQQGSPQFDALLSQSMYLIQVTAADTVRLAASRQAIVQFGDGTHSTAHWISVFPQVDPRLQTPSALYLVPAHRDLVPGISLPVFLPVGPLQSGVIIPNDAVVWWQGKAWCYLETSPGKFTREEVVLSNPVPGGWFATAAIDPGERVVTSGAQTLLSEEFRSQIQPDQD
jgi:hypothetical protein